MSQHLNKKFEEILAKYHIHSILVAISGGQDSLYLINQLNYLKQNKKLNDINYIYIDHQWKKESKNQIIHLVNYLTILQHDIYIYQISSNCFTEKISRICRYHLLIEHAIQHKSQCIVTAHNQTDRIETFLYNLIKGTSLDGATSLNILRQIHPKLYIFRPLLDINRWYINWICRKSYLPVWSDNSNYNFYLDRNRIRNELIPYLKNYFNNNIEKNFIKFLDICNEDNEYIKQNTIKLYLKSYNPYYMALNHIIINKQHIALRKRILQLFIFHNSNIILDNQTIHKVIQEIDNTQLLSSLKYHNLTIRINKIWIYLI